jgi:two-component system response regulator CpxR
MLPLCLVVSADSAHVATLQSGLRSHGLKLYPVADLAAMTPILGQWRFDAVLCDADGLAAEAVVATIRWLRREQRAPIVVLASAGPADAPLAALEAGATELIDKATSVQLIALKLQRLIELAADPAEAEPAGPVSLGELRLDPRREAAFYGDRPLALTGGEFELLLLLAARSGGYVHRGTIMQSLRRTGASGEPRRSADMHVCRIRRKLRDAGASSLALETIHGRGYALRLRGEPDPQARGF